MGENESLENFETAIITNNHLPYKEIRERRGAKFIKEIKYDAGKVKRLLHFGEKQSRINTNIFKSVK